MIKIAIVDDHALLRDALKVMLESLGNVEILFEASDGKDFLNLLEVFTPDVSIVDINMPIMDGIAASITAKQKLPEMKVVILSMIEEEQKIRDLWNSNIDGYVLKTTRFEELAYAIKTVLKGERYFSQQLLLKFINNNIIKYSVLFTDREKTILQYLSEGLSTSEIADRLFLSTRTVEKYRSDMLLRTGLPNSVSLVVFAIKHGIINVRL
ncbi:MAG: response regulator transcription factor [Bacteroidota bacterium]|nr:response regulator transcription factor [Bacteroidota bacterium]